MMKMNKKTVFTLDDIETKKIKKGILLLESSNFEVIHLTLSSSIDEREREYEIEERIREKIENYDDFEFIEKEIIIDESDIISFSILILLKKDILEEILSLIEEKKIELYGIYPLFLTELFNPHFNNGVYLEFSENEVNEFYFEKGKLIKFNSILFPIKEIFTNPHILYEESFKSENQDFFTYSHNDFIREVFPDIKINIINKENLKFNKSLNFLPQEKLKNLIYKKTLNFSLIFTSIFVLIFLVSSLFFKSQNNKLYSNINHLEIKLRNIKNEKEQLLEQIGVCEENIENFTTEATFSKPFYNLSNTVLSIFSIAKNLEISKFEYDGINRFIITGRAKKQENIFYFFNSLKNIQNINFLNHDFIEYKNNYYNFKIEVEVLN